MAQKNNKFLDGFFVKRVWRDKNDPDNEILSIGITDKGVDALMGIEPNKNGFRNLKIGAQKNDRSKFSVWEDDYKPNSSQQEPKASASTKAEKEDESDDLPF